MCNFSALVSLMFFIPFFPFFLIPTPFKLLPQLLNWNTLDWISSDLCVATSNCQFYITLPWSISGVQRFSTKMAAKNSSQSRTLMVCIPSKGGACFPWWGLVTCFDQKNTLEVMLCQFQAQDFILSVCLSVCLSLSLSLSFPLCLSLSDLYLHLYLSISISFKKNPSATYLMHYSVCSINNC